MLTLKPQVYKQKSLTFIVAEDKVIIRTMLNQTFYLEPKAHYWRKRLRLIQTMITLNEIRDLDELASWCGNGIEWQTTYANYDLDKMELIA